jgi:hypothetical protein
MNPAQEKSVEDQVFGMEVILVKIRNETPPDNTWI